MPLLSEALWQVAANLFGGGRRQILVQLGHDQCPQGRAHLLTQQTEKIRCRNDHQPLQLLLCPALFQPLAELPGKQLGLLLLGTGG